jgi:hypothetical protein
MSQLLPRLQNAYRAHHSTETAVLMVLANILHGVDSGFGLVWFGFLTALQHKKGH